MKVTLIVKAFQIYALYPPPTPSKTNISIGRPLDPSMNVQRIVVIDKKKNAYANANYACTLDQMNIEKLESKCWTMYTCCK